MQTIESINKTPSVTVSVAVQAKLDRMAELHQELLFSESCDYNEPIAVEFRAIQSELVVEFMPLVEMLVSAGLLSVAIELLPEDEAEKFQLLSGEPFGVFVNGNICLQSEFSGGCYHQ